MASRKYLLIFAGILIAAIVIYWSFPKGIRNNKSLQKSKRALPYRGSVTGELVAKSSEKIFGPQCLRQIGVWQVKIQDIIPDGTVVDSGQYVAALDRTEISTRSRTRRPTPKKLESQLTKTRLDTHWT